MRRLLVAPMIALSLPARAGDGAFARYRPVAQRVADAVNAGDGAAIQPDLSPDARLGLPPEKLTPVFKGMVRGYGKLVDLGSADLRPPFLVYPARFERGKAELKLVFDGESKITGMFFVPQTPAPPAPVPGHHKTALSLPFRGRWLVFWGGDTEELNRHHDVRNQRFAFDFIGLDGKGATHQGDGKSNPDYFAYGRQVLAPADGEVTQAIDGVSDNAPGSMNPYSALGNAVVIEHAKGEVSVLAHLQPGSVKVKKGDKVRRDQVLGLCGNSGNSSEPHLHYHLQDSPVIQDAAGMKVFFKGPGGDSSPVKGDVLSVD